MSESSLQTLLEQCVAHTRFGHLEPAAVSSATTFLLDCLAIGVAGRASVFRDPLLGVVRSWGDGADARVLGDDIRLPASAAAFMNTFQMHCLEFDAVHEPAVAHVMTAVSSAALADAELAKGRGDPVSGERLVTALVVGVEVAATLGLAANAPLTFFRPATTGVFGAAAAIASLRGYDQNQVRDAFGYALSQCGGTMQAHEEGKPTLPMQLAAAARAGMVSADLAATGIPAPAQSIHGKHGYLALFETDTDFSGLSASVGKPWRVTELSHKPFPSGRATHGGVEAVLRLRELGASADNLERFELSAPPLIHQLVIRPATKDMNVNYARLCFPYVGAVALRFGGVRLEHFDEPALRDPSTLALANRIQASVSDNSDPAAFTPQTLTATLKDGRTLTTTIEQLLGSTRHPLSSEQIADKVVACVATVYDAEQAAALMESVASVTELIDVATLLDDITGAGNR